LFLLLSLLSLALYVAKFEVADQLHQGSVQTDPARTLLRAELQEDTWLFERCHDDKIEYRASDWAAAGC
jgi:hypothetical protein